MPGSTNATYLLQRAKSAGPSFHYRSPATPVLQRQPTIVMYADENRPLHSVHASVDAAHYHQGSQPEMSPPNNPDLAQTQRNVVGNNLRFQSASFRFRNPHEMENDPLASMMIYRDALKQNLTTPVRAGGGLPKMHYGRSGGAWRHIKQTNTYSNANLLFIDGTVRVDDSIKYPMHATQQMYVSPSNPDLSQNTSRSFEPMTWSATDELHRRPSLSRYTNRYEQHAKDGFVYWPRDAASQKPRSRTTSTGTYKTWLGLSDAILKV